jgi:vacuolar-type H+-ATPase subunit I/STV1
MAQRTSTDFGRAQVDRGGDREVSGWAISGAIFAAVIMIVTGVFHVIAGLTAIIKDKFFVVTPNYLLTFNVSGWGWIHLVIGALLVLAGIFVLRGNLLARAVGITMAAISAIANFLFIPYYPFWALLMIGLDVFVIWALASYGRRAASTY